MRLGIFLLSYCLSGVSQALLAEGWKPLRVVGLDYPAIARGTALEGTVVVECRLDKKGKVTAADVRFESRSNRTLESLRDAAIENATKWRFMKTAGSVIQGSGAMLKYQFKLRGTTRSTPRQEFIFEYPDTVTVISEMPCADHIPCTEEDLERYRKQRKSTPIP